MQTITHIDYTPTQANILTYTHTLTHIHTLRHMVRAYYYV